DSVMFVAAKIQRKFTGNGAVKINRCSHPGKEWMVPSAVVQIKKGKLKVPIVNLQSGPLQFKRRDLITMIDIDLEAEVTMETKEANSPIIRTATAEKSVPKPCPSWVQKLRLGDELSEKEKISLLAVIKRRWRCFPNKEGQIGKTDQAEHLIDTGDAQPVRSAPYRVSRYEREIIVDEVAKMMRAGMIRPSSSPWSAPVVLVPVAEKNQCKTAFITPDGLYEFRRQHLGHVIDGNGIRPHPDKVQALVNFKTHDVKSLRGFLGPASYFRRFIPNFAAVASPLYGLQNAPWIWSEKKQSAKQKLVQYLTSAPVLAHFNEKLDVVIQTDASNLGLGAVLLQDDGAGPRLVAF
ncbi:putative Histone-lysine N-methyltransferase NSD2, partial [Daphnia magna]